MALFNGMSKSDSGYELMFMGFHYIHSTYTDIHVL